MGGSMSYVPEEERGTIISRGTPNLSAPSHTPSSTAATNAKNIDQTMYPRLCRQLFSQALSRCNIAKHPEKRFCHSVHTKTVTLLITPTITLEPVLPNWTGEDIIDRLQRSANFKKITALSFRANNYKSLCAQLPRATFSSQFLAELCEYHLHDDPETPATGVATNNGRATLTTTMTGCKESDNTDTVNVDMSSSPTGAQPIAELLADHRPGDILHCIPLRVTYDYSENPLPIQIQVEISNILFDRATVDNNLLANALNTLRGSPWSLTRAPPMSGSLSGASLLQESGLSSTLSEEEENNEGVSSSIYVCERNDQICDASHYNVDNGADAHNTGCTSGSTSTTATKNKNTETYKRCDNSIAFTLEKSLVTENTPLGMCASVVDSEALYQHLRGFHEPTGEPPITTREHSKNTTATTSSTLVYKNTVTLDDVKKTYLVPLEATASRVIHNLTSPELTTPAHQDVYSLKTAATEAIRALDGSETHAAAKRYVSTFLSENEFYLEGDYMIEMAVEETRRQIAADHTNQNRPNNTNTPHRGNKTNRSTAPKFIGTINWDTGMLILSDDPVHCVQIVSDDSHVNSPSSGLSSRQPTHAHPQVPNVGVSPTTSTTTSRSPPTSHKPPQARQPPQPSFSSSSLVPVYAIRTDVCRGIRNRLCQVIHSKMEYCDFAQPTIKLSINPDEELAFIKAAENTVNSILRAKIMDFLNAPARQTHTADELASAHQNPALLHAIVFGLDLFGPRQTEDLDPIALTFTVDYCTLK